MLRAILSNSSLFLPLGLSVAVLGAPACAKPGAPAGEELALGAALPAFELRGVDDQLHSLTGPDESKALVVVFTCLSCPVARAYEDRIIGIAREYAEQGVRFVAVMPNSPKIVPADGFDKMKARAAEKKYPFTFLFDESQAVARAFGARVTPHVFLFGADGKLAYRGRVDDSTDPEKVGRQDLREAIEAVIAGQEVAVAATKAFGCTIKWKSEKSS